MLAQNAIPAPRASFLNGKPKLLLIDGKLVPAITVARLTASIPPPDRPLRKWPTAVSKTWELAVTGGATRF